MRLLVLGTGGMANNHANFAPSMASKWSAPSMSIRPASLCLPIKHNIPKRFRSLDEAIAWGEFDAATNVTPDRIHHPTTMALIKAGKHVFCEKPLAETMPRRWR
jgi:predicted dehydrogenase